MCDNCEPRNDWNDEMMKKRNSVARVDICMLCMDVCI